MSQWNFDDLKLKTVGTALALQRTWSRAFQLGIHPCIWIGRLKCLSRVADGLAPVAAGARCSFIRICRTHRQRTPRDARHRHVQEQEMISSKIEHKSCKPNAGHSIVWASSSGHAPQSFSHTVIGAAHITEACVGRNGILY